jgi:tRNA(Ile)-lysidine synthase
MKQWPGAVAVSGGGDSLALMLMLARAKKKPAPIVLTVDHGLRPDSAKDAKAVLQAAKKLGLEAHLLQWKGAKPKSDIEAAAREARYRLMGEWCAKHKIGALYLAHTLEDQAETFLLRLARGSGLDGLSAMQEVAPFPLPGYGELKLVRPLLSVTRAQLRAYLKKSGLEWRDDPMNEDPRFARVRIRQSWPQLEEIGLSPTRIAAAAGHRAGADRTVRPLRRWKNPARRSDIGPRPA